jgi:hypothetical protein
MAALIYHSLARKFASGGMAKQRKRWRIRLILASIPPIVAALNFLLSHWPW